MGRTQGNRRWQDYREYCSYRHQGGPEERHLHLPGPLPDQDPPQACDEGLQEGNLRKDANGEGKASSDDREGFPSGGFEEERLGSCSACISSPWRCCGTDWGACDEAPI